MIRWLVVAAVVAASACHKEPAPAREHVAPTETAVMDTLWAKAPEGTVVGIVVSPRGMVMVEHAWKDVHAFLKSFPAFAPAERALAGAFRNVGIDEFDWADFGVDPGKGIGVFLTGGAAKGLSVFGIADYDRFISRSHLQCKPIEDGYYACTKLDTAIFAKLGKGGIRPKLDAVKARGDIEIVSALAPFELAAAMQLERGGFVLRGVVAGVPSTITSKLGAPLRPTVDLEHTAGFGLVNVAPLLAAIPPFPITAGVTSMDVARSISGPLSITVGGGDVALDLRVPLSDPQPARKLVEHCKELPAFQAAGATVEGGTCSMVVPDYNLAVEIAVDGQELHLRTKGRQMGPAPVSAIGRELATGEWQAVFWGRGTLLSSRRLFPPRASADDPVVAMAVRALLMLDELGVAVSTEGDRVRFILEARTAWSNPDDVVAKLVAVTPTDILAGKGGERGKPIAEAAPTSPFAADYQAGITGLLIPLMPVALAAGYAVGPSILGPAK